ncbi:hypothetical protein Tco_0856782 [Tanacetum coccineum]|uniref:Uncharacterized protein n=1 Tax=Tanacetum coccineum TaxID=301880 RepID=A0ABQ5B4F8_9ASTR
MQTKIELTLEQSQQGVSNDVLILRFEWKPCQGGFFEIYLIHRFDDVLQAHVHRVGFITTLLILSSFQSQSFNIKIVDSNLPHYQRASKSNKVSSIGEIVRLIITYVKQECNKYEHVGQEHNPSLAKPGPSRKDPNATYCAQGYKGPISTHWRGDLVGLPLHRAINTSHGATTASTQATAVNSTTIDNLSDAVICAFFASQPNSPKLTIRKCDAAEKAYEAKREKELAIMQCKELEFLMIDHSSLPPAKRAIIERKQAEIMRKYPDA